MPENTALKHQDQPFQVVAMENESHTVNATGETLVLNKDFPSIKQGFYQQNGGKVGKIVIFPALSKYFPSIKMGKSLFSTRVSPVTFTVWLVSNYLLKLLSNLVGN